MSNHGIQRAYMVFKSKNILRTCKWCSEPRRKFFDKVSGRFKGYAATCGKDDCLKAAYKDATVCTLKARLKVANSYVCRICEQQFKQTHPSNRSYCKVCVPDRTWRARAQRYGIGKPQWDQLVQNQNGTCALCNNLPDAVDHCHKTRTVRGLLCFHCNAATGYVYDRSADWIEKALIYCGQPFAKTTGKI